MLNVDTKLEPIFESIQQRRKIYSEEGQKIFKRARCLRSNVRNFPTKHKQVGLRFLYNHCIKNMKQYYFYCFLVFFSIDLNLVAFYRKMFKINKAYMCVQENWGRGAQNLVLGFVHSSSKTPHGDANSFLSNFFFQYS